MSVTTNNIAVAVLALGLVAGAAAQEAPGHGSGAGPVSGTAQGRHVHRANEAPLVRVEGAWVRAAVEGQSGTGGFMKLTASQPLTLEGFSTPAAQDNELHEMAMEGGVMHMRAIDSLTLPAGQTVSLEPGAGGHHLMLTGLRHALKAGQRIELTLHLRSADGKHLSQRVEVPVLQAPPGRSSGGSGASGEMHEHQHEHEH